MSLLIEDMDMPKSCMECICLEAIDDEIYNRQLFCGLLGIDALARKHSRHKKCPLSEIPTPHGDLIDRDQLLDVLDKIILNPDSYAQRCMAMATKEILINQPTIVEAEE